MTVMTPRPACCGRTIVGAVLAAVIGCSTAPAVAATWGLVVGIDAYRHLSPLHGAVNDARDVAAALRSAAAAEVTLLLDEAATRRAILDAWAEIVAKASPGDTVVFSYAGHGSQEPERVPGSERDGRDEVFLLAGFRETRPGNGERILDDEIHALFAAASDLRILFVADSCHSGTMMRSFDARAGGASTRLARYGPIRDDELPPPPPGARDERPLGHVTSVAAVRDDEQVMEIAIEGQPRGILSWAFARALGGSADANADDLLDGRELEGYLVETVHIVSAGRQLPQMQPAADPTALVLPIGGAAAAAGGEAPLRVDLLGVGLAASYLARLSGVVERRPGERADLVWDLRDGQVVSATGDVVALLPPGPEVAGFQGVVDKWLLLRDLRRYGEARPLALRVLPDARLHRRGDKVVVWLPESRHPRLTLFNLAVDGTLQFLAPAPRSPNPLYSGDLPLDRPFELPLKVTPPFGADHLVALTSSGGLPALEDELRRLDGRRAAAELREQLPRLLPGHDYQLGTIGLMTAR